MRTEDFDYFLPPDLVAQNPLSKRDECRLLCLDRRTGVVSGRIFKDLPELVKPGDLLVFNDTKVMPARIFCHKRTGGKVELLLTDSQKEGRWKALVRPGKGLNPGTEIMIDKSPGIVIMIESVEEDGSRIIFLKENAEETFENCIDKYGVMALPHYIKRPAALSDNETYQTIYARHQGAIASPTAGLHFTEDLIARLAQMGVGIAFVTLHVGIGTFSPVKVDDPRKHRMHCERYEVSRETAEKIEKTKKHKGRVIAVGTTVVRTLEHCAGNDAGIDGPCTGETDIFILPGYRFKVIDAMITNFHVPRSTLLMLVSAFAGREEVLKAYGHAVEERYRFFSYGDAMMIF